MKPEIRKQLSDILDTRQKQKDAATAWTAEKQSAEEKNLADFNAAKEKVIKPAFQEIVELYKAKGMSAHIVEQDEQYNSRGPSTPASIGLDLAQEEHRGNTMKPQFRFIFDRRTRTISLYTSTGSQGGPAGTPVPLDSVTAEWIQNAFVNYASR